MDFIKLIFLFLPIFQAKAYSKEIGTLWCGERNGKGEVVLLDHDGAVLNTWKFNRIPFHAYLQPDGTLYVIHNKTDDEKINSPANRPLPLLQRVDWKGKILWEYYNPLMHHDFEILPDGNVAVLTWRKMKAEISQLVRGGRGSKQPIMWTDEILVISENKKVIWRWSFEDHLSPQKHKIGSHHYRYEWTHSNSLHYTSQNPIDQTEAFLVSARSLDQVFLIRKSDGRILWENHQGLISGQHDARFLPNGNILVFDNGLRKSRSRVIEITPNKESHTAWSFPSSRNETITHQFFSSIMGGAQRLSDGTVLITNSVQGFVSWVDRKGRVIKTTYSPFSNPKGSYWPYPLVFRVGSYDLGPHFASGRLQKPN